MAKKPKVKKKEVPLEDDALEADEMDVEADDEWVEDDDAAILEVEEELEIDATVVDTDVADEDDSETETDDDLGDGEALDELEAEELDMLTEDEESEVIQVDLVAEMRALRREELELDADAEIASPNEFVCQSCFLVKRFSQLADKRRKICADCAA